MAVVNVHFVFRFAVSHLDGLHPGCDVLALRLLTYRASERWDLLSCMCAELLSCVQLCDPMDYSLPGSSVHGVFQARILEWVAISYSRGSS